MNQIIQFFNYVALFLMVIYALRSCVMIWSATSESHPFLQQAYVYSAIRHACVVFICAAWLVANR